MLFRSFDNIIINAYKHSTSNLKVQTKIQENKITIKFTNKLEDSNLDISAIFDEFYTSDISRTKENTGLGLAIAKEFIRFTKTETLQQRRKKEYLKYI